MWPMSTFSGIPLEPREIRPEQVRIEDIAHALSLLCRGGGQIRWFYSVAQHSINCCLEAQARGRSVRGQLICLLHDAAEAYVGDLIRPLKSTLAEFREIEDSIQSVILRHFGIEDLSDVENALWRTIDDEILNRELKTLMPGEENREEQFLSREPDLAERPWQEIEVRYTELVTDLVERVRLYPNDTEEAIEAAARERAEKEAAEAALAAAQAAELSYAQAVQQFPQTGEAEGSVGLEKAEAVVMEEVLEDFQEVMATTGAAQDTEDMQTAGEASGEQDADANTPGAAAEASAANAAAAQSADAERLKEAPASSDAETTSAAFSGQSRPSAAEEQAKTNMGATEDVSSVLETASAEGAETSSPEAPDEAADHGEAAHESESEPETASDQEIPQAQSSVAREEGAPRRTLTEELLQTAEPELAGAAEEPAEEATASAAYPADASDEPAGPSAETGSSGEEAVGGEAAASEPAEEDKAASAQPEEPEPATQQGAAVQNAEEADGEARQDGAEETVPGDDSDADAAAGMSGTGGTPGEAEPEKAADAAQGLDSDIASIADLLSELKPEAAAASQSLSPDEGSEESAVDESVRDAPLDAEKTTDPSEDTVEPDAE